MGFFQKTAAAITWTAAERVEEKTQIKGHENHYEPTSKDL